MEKTKICRTCGEEKNLGDFYKGRLKCKKCVGIESKRRYERNKSIRLRQCAEYRKKHREELLEYFRERYKNNREEILKKQKEGGIMEFYGWHCSETDTDIYFEDMYEFDASDYAGGTLTFTAIFNEMH